MPDTHQLQYLVYQVCQGKPAGKEAAENMTYLEAEEWMLLRSYDNYAQEKMVEHRLDKAKKLNG